MPWINKKSWKAFWFGLCDPNLYVKLENIYPALKQKHRNGNFPLIKLAMAISRVPLWDFVVWLSFNELLIIRTEFDELFFHEFLNKLNIFYKGYMLSKICGSNLKFCLLFQDIF